MKHLLLPLPCCKGIRFAAAALLVALGAVQTVPGSVVVLTTSKDNTLYEDSTGSRSNGAGEHVFAGKVGFGTIRRALVAFDVAGNIPSGSTITGVTLTLSMSMTNVSVQSVSLHRVQADWGEGMSDAPSGEGGGADSTPGDATWIHRFYDTDLWTNPGGDFDALPSASTDVDAVDRYSWSSAAMVAEVQSWLDDPASNYGWILIGDEGEFFPTAKRFDSKESLEPGTEPALTVCFTPPLGPVGAGRVPDGDVVPGEPLRVGKDLEGDLLLTWGRSCVPCDTDYEVYEGMLENFTSHAYVFCGTGGDTSATVPLTEGNSYYLVVPRNPTEEGSYGTRSDGIERPPATSACVPQAIDGCP